MSSDASARDPANAAKMVALGKYQVLSHIATGGMGAVYRARDTENDRDVAVKILNPKMASRPDAVVRFYREARNSARMRHENIVTVYEAGEHKGVIYLAMEFIDGMDLADHINEMGRLDVEEARQITFQAARALLHAHKRGIVHRDIKPSNFLLAHTEGHLVVKLTDLGLSRQVDEDEFRLTRLGSTVGTIDYISPEQARDSNSADVRSDIYSLGCTLYHMLTGQTPFPDGGLAERIYQHLSVEPRNVRELRADVPETLATIVQKMLAKDPADRYQTPRGLLEDLTRAGSPPKREPRRRRPGPIAPPPEPGGPRLRRSESPTLAGPETSPGLPTRANPDTEPEPKEKRPRSRDKKKSSAQQAWVLASAGASTVLLGLIVLVLILRSNSDPEPEPDDTQVAQPPSRIEQPDPPTVTEPKDPPKPESEKPWPPLRAGMPAIDREYLTRRFSAMQEGLSPAGDVPIYRVRRQPREPGQYASLGEAFRAVQEKGGAGAPDGKPRVDAVIEIHDSGPLYEGPLTLVGISVIVRAAPGHRPLVFWDLERQTGRPGTPLLAVQDGSLELEGLEIVLHSPRPAAGRLTIVQVARGDFQTRGCTFSAAGIHPPGIVLVRMQGARKNGSPSRCRLSRCLARGGSLVGLDLGTGSHDVLLDDTLITGGAAPLFELRVKPGDRLQLFLLRSTLVAQGTGVRVTADGDAGLTSDTFRCLAWDTLLSHSGSGRAGVLLEIPERMRKEMGRWEGRNCLYTGWRHLLRGPRDIDGADAAAWENHWSAFGGVERSETAPWPSATFPELAEVSALEYRTDRVKGGPVGFAASASSDKTTPTLGCPVALLTPARDRWAQWTVERFRTSSVDLIRDATAPSIPAAADGLYHGERLDVSTIDVGLHLAQAEQSRRLGKRVVLHLYRSAERKSVPSTPIRIRGADLVLFLESGKPATKDAPEERLILQGNGLKDAPALIEIEEGNLDLIGGEIRVPDAVGWGIRIKGGSLRSHDCHLHAPIYPGEGFQGLIHLERGKDSLPQSVGLHQCVLVSGKRGLSLQGTGVRARLVQSLLVAGTDALNLTPGRSASPRLDLSCVMDNVTLAAGRAAVRIGELPAGSIDEPVVIQARACAYLNPFAGRSGLLLCEDDALQRSAILWQGEADLHDRRLHFSAASPATIPEKPEPFAAWLKLWGPGLARRVQGDFPQGSRFEKESWALARLVLTPVGARPGAFDTRSIGADLERLGVLNGPPRPR